MATQVQVPTIGSLTAIVDMVVSLAEKVAGVVMILMLADLILQAQGIDIPFVKSPPASTLIYMAGIYALLTRRIKLG